MAIAHKGQMPTNIKQLIEYSRTDEAKKKHVQDTMWEVYFAVSQGVGMAKALGYIPERHAQADKSICTATTLYKHLDEIPDDLNAHQITHHFRTHSVS